MKAKSFLTLLSFCLLFLLPLSLCAQEPVCGKCYKKKSLCPYSCNHPKCKPCGKFCGARVNPCPYGGKHPKCSVCGKLKENCAYKGNHPKCNACGQLKENCTYRGNHPQCTTCGKLRGTSSDACPYDGSHPKCSACGQVKENCVYRGNHPQCTTCGKLCGASSNACPYDGKHYYEGGSYREYTVNGVRFKMIAVEGGVFTMGATSEQQNPEDDEKPTHTVTLSDYYIGETEVTQELWAAVMGNNPSRFTGNMQRPVEQVSWEDCQTFIQKLNQLTGANFRLPTEAEWEFAARGGRSSRGYQYSGSSNLDDVAWYGGNSSNTTHPVKTKSPNELGIYDMSGNVNEWCQDWKGSYSSSSQTNPTGPSTGSYRVSRGSNWLFNAHSSCRSAARPGCAPSGRNSIFGLRLAL